MKTEKSKNEKIQIPLSLTTVSPCKTNVQYELLSLYILMIKKWDSTNKSETKYKTIQIIKK